ncbi:MAG: hypothetical protein AB8B89_02620 [Gammaproteobacteria bacterium]
MNNLTTHFQSSLLKSIVLTLIYITLSTSFADNLPSNYPKVFLWSGTIDEIKNTSVTIEDREFNLTPNISVHLLKSYNRSIKDLKTGMTVGCQISESNELVALWEFPDSLSSASGPWAGDLFDLQKRGN